MSAPRGGMRRRRAVVWVPALLLLAVGAGALLVGRMRAGPGLPTGDVTADGVTAPVEVLWDSVGIPQL